MVRPPSFPSNFDSSVFVDRQHSAVTMICDSNRAKNHALLAVERIDDTRQLTTHLVHLMGIFSNKPLTKGAFKGKRCFTGFQRMGTVEIKDMTGRRIDYTHKSPTWRRSAEKVQEMMKQAELEKNKPFEFPRPFSIFGNRSIFTSSLKTIRITDPSIQELSRINYKVFKALYNIACLSIELHGPTVFNNPFFFVIPGLFTNRPLNILDEAIKEAENKVYTRKQVYDSNAGTATSGYGRDVTIKILYKEVIGAKRISEIKHDYSSASTNEKRQNLIDIANKRFDAAQEILGSTSLEEIRSREIYFMTRIKNGVEHRIEECTDIATKLLTKVPQMQNYVDELIAKNNGNVLKTYHHILKIVAEGTNLLTLTPDSCFTWAREKLSIIDVKIEDVGVEFCVSLTRCYLDSVKTSS